MLVTNEETSSGQLFLESKDSAGFDLVGFGSVAGYIFSVTN